MTYEVAVGSGVFTLVVMTLVVLVLVARAWLVPTGSATIVVNGERRLEVQVGQKLLAALAAQDVYLPAACGGRGTCGQCRIVVRSGGGAPAPVEASLVSRRERDSGVRLACQIAVREDLAVAVPREVLGVRRWQTRVRSNRNVATLMKEVVLELPAGETIEFQAGAYVLVTCPPHHTRLRHVEVGPAFHAEWDRLRLWDLAVSSPRETTRAYSIASHPGEPGIVTLLVRIAVPPPGAPPGTPPGIVSSYLFARRPGDIVEIAGPYGSFGVTDSEREMILVGGGAGMAPLRSIVFDQLRRRGTTRPITFWYGARNLQELFYREDFDCLAAEFPNFQWHVALSDPREEDAWEGDTGFVHAVLHERYLKDHAAPEECEYYLCGPPMMLRATLRLLERLGVARESISFDDFGT